MNLDTIADMARLVDETFRRKHCPVCPKIFLLPHRAPLRNTST